MRIAGSRKQEGLAAVAVGWISCKDASLMGRQAPPRLSELFRLLRAELDLIESLSSYNRLDCNNAFYTNGSACFHGPQRLTCTDTADADAAAAWILPA